MLAEQTPYLLTRSGRAWPLLAPTADAVHWPDVAVALSRICRYAGHTPQHYSVAEHCCHVHDYLERNARRDAQQAPERQPRIAQLGLLHDAHEFVLGDTTSPLKMALRVLAGARYIAAWGALEHATDAAIYAAAGIEAPNSAEARLVKQADVAVLRAEKVQLGLGQTLALDAEAASLIADVDVQCWEPTVAAEQFLHRLASWQQGGRACE